MAGYDGLAYNGRIEALREKEYPMLKGVYCALILFYKN